MLVLGNSPNIRYILQQSERAAVVFINKSSTHAHFRVLLQHEFLLPFLYILSFFEHLPGKFLNLSFSKCIVANPDLYPRGIHGAVTGSDIGVQISSQITLDQERPVADAEQPRAHDECTIRRSSVRESIISDTTQSIAVEEHQNRRISEAVKPVLAVDSFDHDKPLLSRAQGSRQPKEVM